MLPGTFRATERPAVSFRTIPKRGGGSRVLTQLAPEEDSEYRRVVADVTPRIEASLGPAVLAERCRIGSARSGPSLVTPPLADARSRLRARVRGLSRDRPGAVVLADVRCCFASITPRVVEGRLLETGCGRAETPCFCSRGR